MSLVLGIDGGGSKTEAAIADADEAGNILERSLVKKGSNPWKSGGIELASGVVAEALAGLSRLPEVTACVAGISGCHGDATFHKAFRKVIATALPNAKHIEITGDLSTSFRSGASGPHGQIAVAGSGSAIAQFFPGGSSYGYDSVSYGGRDIAAAIILAGARGELSAKTTQWIEQELQQKLAHFEDLHQLYSVEAVVHLPTHIAKLPPNNPILAELRPILMQCATRWAYKLWGAAQRYRMKTGWPKEAVVETVLSGQIWNFTLIRQEVERLMQKSDSHIRLIHAKQSPVHGALAMAHDLLHSEPAAKPHST